MVTREQAALERELELQELEGWEYPAKPRSFVRDVAVGVLVGLGAVLVSALVACVALAAAGTCVLLVLGAVRLVIEGEA